MLHSVDGDGGLDAWGYVGHESPEVALERSHIGGDVVVTGRGLVAAHRHDVRPDFGTVVLAEATDEVLDGHRGDRVVLRCDDASAITRGFILAGDSHQREDAFAEVPEHVPGCERHHTAGVRVHDLQAHLRLCAE